MNAKRFKAMKKPTEYSQPAGLSSDNCSGRQTDGEYRAQLQFRRRRRVQVLRRVINIPKIS